MTSSIAGKVGDPDVGSRLELVAFFARTGDLPWWADGSRPRLVDEGLAFLVRTAPRAVGALIRELTGDRRPLQRIVLHCGDPTLVALLGVLGSVTPSDIEVLLKAHRVVPGVRAGAYRNAVWQAVLRTACSKAPCGVRFWREALAQVALELGVTYVSLLADLGQTLAVRRQPDRLGAIVEELYREMVGDPWLTALRDGDRVARTGVLVRLLRPLVEQGLMPDDLVLRCLAAAEFPAVADELARWLREAVQALPPEEQRQEEQGQAAPVATDGDRAVGTGVLVRLLRTSAEQGLLPADLVRGCLAFQS